MSYVERIIIGVVLVLSAYTLYTGAQERHNFHLAINQLSKLTGRCLGCFTCIQSYRKALVVLIFTGGATLIMDAGVTFAIIGQLLLTALNASQLRGDIQIAQYQSVLINFALLVFLFRNIADFRHPKETNHHASNVKPEVNAEVKAASPVSSVSKEEKGKAGPVVEPADLQKGRGKKKN